MYIGVMLYGGDIYIYILHIGDILGLYRGYIRAQGNPLGSAPFSTCWTSSIVSAFLTACLKAGGLSKWGVI